MLRIRIQDGGKAVFRVAKLAALLLIVLGAVFLGLAIIYTSSIQALVGLGLVFWGIVLTYIQTEQYVRKDALDATTGPLLAALNQTLEELDYRGKAVYLPPNYLNDPEITLIYVARKETDRLPSPDETQELEKLASNRNKEGMLMVPPGAELTKLLETALGTPFIRTNLDELQKRLPKLLIEDLELATDLEIQTLDSKTLETNQADSQTQTKIRKVLVSAETDIYSNTVRQSQQLSLIKSNIGCPLTSAIASIIARATGKPTIIRNQQASEDGRTTETEYAILEDEG